MGGPHRRGKGITKHEPLLHGSILPERPLAVGPGYHQPDGSTPGREAQESR